MRGALAPLYEEVGEHAAAVIGEEAGGDFDTVVELGVVHDGEDGAAGAGLGVGGGVDEAGDAGVEDGSGAHGAGLEGDVEGAAAFLGENAVVFEGAAGGAEGDDFGVGGGVVVAEDAIVAAADDVAVGGDDDCADGDFAGGFGGVGFGYGFAEVIEIGDGGFGHGVG